MKRICLILSLFLLLTGCARQEPPAPVPEADSPPAQTEVPSPPPEAEPIPEPELEPEPESEPEAPAAETPELPDLPYPVYCWGDTAVAPDGTVILQVPEHTLEPCYDAVSGNPRGILSLYQDGFVSRYTGFYDLDGQRILTDPIEMGCAGDLMWYGDFRNFTVQRMSDGEILAEGVKNIVVMVDQVALLPSFKYGSIVLLDSRTGETTLEADRGFRPAQVFYENSARAYLSVTAPDGNGQNLIDHTGKPLLDAFQYEIYEVQQDRAIVRAYENGQYVRHVIDLDTQQVLYRADHGTYMRLLPESLLIEKENVFYLVDYQDQLLYDTPIEHFTFFDWEQDGDPEYVVATVLLDDAYRTVLLKPDGTELAVLPAEQWQDVEPISPTSLAYTIYSGKGPLYEEARYYDLETGEDVLLAEGPHLFLERIETSGGNMLRCEVDGTTQLFLNDGTPVWTYPGYCNYLGGDVFSTDEGLRCLDGSWLYRPES